MVMERLTYRDKDGMAMMKERGGWKSGGIDRLAAYEDSGLDPEQVMELKSFTQGGIHKVDDGWKHVQDLLQAERDGRLEVLPCKVGDHILADGREAIVVWFFGYKTGRYLHAQFLDNAECTDIPFYEIGKNLFLTREEAEATLKGGEG